MSTHTMVHTQYRNAPDYDWEHKFFDVDLPWLKKLCTRYANNGKVLNLCCGTGRETIPLARMAVEQGFTITGVDVTKSMLNRFREKLVKEPQPVQEILTLVQDDIRFMDVGKGAFDFAFVPFNSFLHLLTTEDQLMALRNIFDHLAPGGHFIADIFCPSVDRLGLAVGPTWVREEKVVADEENGLLLVRKATAKYDQAAQIQRLRFYYQVFELAGDCKLLRSYWSPLTIRMIFPAELRLLLTAAGFEIVEEWGDYEFNSFELVAKKAQSHKMLFLCRKN